MYFELKSGMGKVLQSVRYSGDVGCLVRESRMY
jgi:hypothetical protein